MRLNEPIMSLLKWRIGRVVEGGGFENRAAQPAPVPRQGKRPLLPAIRTAVHQGGRHGRAAPPRDPDVRGRGGEHHVRGCRPQDLRRGRGSLMRCREEAPASPGRDAAASGGGSA